MLALGCLSPSATPEKRWVHSIPSMTFRVPGVCFKMQPASRVDCRDSCMLAAGVASEIRRRLLIATGDEIGGGKTRSITAGEAPGQPEGARRTDRTAVWTGAARVPKRPEWTHLVVCEDSRDLRTAQDEGTGPDSWRSRPLLLFCVVRPREQRL